MNMILGTVVWILAWILAVYFFRRLRNTHEGFLEVILSVILMGVSSRVIGFQVGIWFSVLLVFLTIIMWWISRMEAGK